MKNFLKLFAIFILFNAALANTNFEDEFDEFLVVESIEKDKYEKFNRKVFYFNEKLDLHIIMPLLKVYRIVPKPVRKSFANVSDTILESPVKIYTSLMAQQGEIALHNTGRFFVNFTFGFFGFFDVASNIGLEKRDFSLGDVFTYYGMEAGNYIVLPVIGGQTSRGALSVPFVMAMSSALVSRNTIGSNGMLMYFFIDSKTIIGQISTSPALDTTIGQMYIWHLIDEYEPLKRQIKEGSIDYYSAYRSMFFQIDKKRELLVKSLRNQHTKVKLKHNKPLSDNRMLDIY